VGREGFEPPAASTGLGRWPAVAISESIGVNLAGAPIATHCPSWDLSHDPEWIIHDGEDCSEGRHWPKRFHRGGNHYGQSRAGAFENRRRGVPLRPAGPTGSMRRPSRHGWDNGSTHATDVSPTGTSGMVAVGGSRMPRGDCDEASGSLGDHRLTRSLGSVDGQRAL
jgi:hypothetical protein